MNSKIGYCACCLKVNDTFSKCSACKSIGYCSKTCQRTDWKEHKNICDPLGEVYDKVSKKHIAKVMSNEHFKKMAMNLLYNFINQDEVVTFLIMPFYKKGVYRCYTNTIENRFENICGPQIFNSSLPVVCNYEDESGRSYSSQGTFTYLFSLEECKLNYENEKDLFDHINLINHGVIMEITDDSCEIVTYSHEIKLCHRRDIRQYVNTMVPYHKNFEYKIRKATGCVFSNPSFEHAITVILYNYFQCGGYAVCKISNSDVKNVYLCDIRFADNENKKAGNLESKLGKDPVVTSFYDDGIRGHSENSDLISAHKYSLDYCRQNYKSSKGMFDKRALVKTRNSSKSWS
jgi:hypothetical protein